MLDTLIGAIILSINIQVGLNMHLYVDIGDVSSSLWGSTSSCPRLESNTKLYALSAPVSSCVWVRSFLQQWVAFRGQ